MYARLLVAALVVLSGCAAVPGGNGGVDTGTVKVYVSDDAKTIEEFAHLNVTVTSVALKKRHTPEQGHRHGWERTEDHRHGHDGGDGDGDGHQHRHEDRWLVYDVADSTVDLTELQRANASLLHAMGVPNGTYTAVRVRIGDVNATLENGTNVSVRVPSGHLTVKESFTVGDGETESFVVDARVKERVENESYVLKPMLSESGSDVRVCPRHHGGDGCDCHGMDAEKTPKTPKTEKTPKTTKPGDGGCHGGRDG